ncbi:PD-(D/E)XK nuclease family transposase [Rubripirellula amarantea]|uniref:PD-(D/E)XK nuclease family transposase n=1 Tax=Rubripirellula amarantea TaxID=2527999 RepID=A0A5C5WUZ4_9BACT|nr:Rpn family recombination-promoting nuclease/putative transposase [Rubripirellula amarantea]TWT54784.1 PD-(D/E)XK nuclease family transposase [Rubripirellula amarantea]
MNADCLAMEEWMVGGVASSNSDDDNSCSPEQSFHCNQAPSHMAIGIDPLVDFAAKRVLGSPEHSRITLHFLNSVLGFASPIVDVEILNPINLKDFDADKLSILDIKAADSVGRRYNIEVQTTRPLGLPKRLTYYAAKQLIEQLGEGDQYADLNPSISICLLDAIKFRDEPRLQHAFGLRTAGGLSLTDCLQVHVFEVPKYVIPSDNEPIADPV